MLERSLAHAAHRRRQARLRARQRLGLAVYPVELDGTVLQLLIRWNWVDEADAGNRERVGAGIAAGLAEIADHMARRR